MAYTTNKRIDQLETLSALASGDLVVIGDVSDSGRAKAITKSDLQTDLLADGVVTDGVTITGDGTTGDPLVVTATAGIKELIDTTEVTVTGTTSDTALLTESITANVLGTNNGIYFYAMGVGTTTAGVINVKYGGTTIAAFTTTIANVRFSISGYIFADNATGAQKCQVHYSGATTPQYTATTIDSTAAAALVISVDPTDVADTFTGESIAVFKIQGSSSSVPTTTPSVASYSSGNSASPTTSLALAKPSGLTVGDLMIGHVEQTDGAGGPTWTLPSGWTQIQQGGSDTMLAYKIATAGDTAASTFTFTTDQTGNWVGTIVRFSNPNTSTPIATSSENTGTNVTATATTVTPTTANSLICMFISNYGIPGSGGWESYAIATSDPTWTEVYDVSYVPSAELRVALAVGTRAATTATGSGTATATGGAAANWYANLVVLNPS